MIIHTFDHNTAIIAANAADLGNCRNIYVYGAANRGDNDRKVYITNIDVDDLSEYDVEIVKDGVGVWEGCKHHSIGFSHNLRENDLTTCCKILRDILE